MKYTVNWINQISGKAQHGIAMSKKDAEVTAQRGELDWGHKHWIEKANEKE